MRDDIPILWPWQGGKGRLASWIASRLPPHRVYVEPFAGTAAVLFAKMPSPIEVLNDANGDIIAVYRCLQDDRTLRRLARRLHWTPISRAEWDRAHEPVNGEEVVEQAARFLIRMTQGFGGKPNASSWGGGASDEIVLRLNRTLRRFRPAAERLARVVLEQGDWQTVVPRYDRPDTLVYCDPPYLTKADHNAYRTGTWTEQEQQRLLDWAITSPSRIVLSGYDHPIYDCLRQAGWHQEFRRLSVSILGRTQQTGLAGAQLDQQAHFREDCVWWSPSAWQAQRQLTWWETSTLSKEEVPH